ncbi:MAG: YCF48-related protein [Haliea sp.]|uniref:WD40/YVTN/BNR-like repeat-containing protein n=1 Tax=Haliea sp. TaxID=1932666 RepID=UPI0032F011EA
MELPATAARALSGILGMLLLAAGALPLPAAAQQALLMPLASESLLLDVKRAGQRLVAVGERGHVLLSDDHGASWRQVAVPTTRVLTALWFVDEHRGWAVGHEGVILATGDAGDSWTLQRGWTSGRPPPDRQREPASAAPLMAVWFADALHGIAVGANGLYLETGDGGENWLVPRELPDNPDQLHLYAIASPDGERLLLAGESGILYRSPDRGQSWEALPSAEAGTLFGLVAEPASNRVLAFGLEGNVLVSADFGDSWRGLASPVEVVLAGGVYRGDGRVLVAGSVGTLLQVELRSGAITSLATGTVTGNFAQAVVAADGAIVLAGQGGLVRLPSADHAGTVKRGAL